MPGLLSEKKILALMDFSDENIQDIEPFLDYETEDIIILVEHSALKRNKAYIKIKNNYCPALLFCPLWCGTQSHTMTVFT